MPTIYSTGSNVCVEIGVGLAWLGSNPQACEPTQQNMYDSLTISTVIGITDLKVDEQLN